MIVLGEIQSYSKKRMRIATHNGCVEVLFSESQTIAISFNVGDRVLLHAPRADSSSRIEYSKSIKIARTPFKWISDIKKDKYCDMIALCNEYKPLVKTKGTDFLFSIVLVDQTGTVELKVFIDQTHYDKIVESNNGEPFKKGDVLLVRNIKRGCSDTTAVTTKPCMISKIASCSSAPVLSSESSFAEWATARFILETCTTAAMRAVVSRKTPLPFSSAKLRTISEITDQSFFNIIGKVIHCDPDQGPTISITDFTASELIAPGVGHFPNNMALVIRLFGQHLMYLKKVVVGRYYMFENIRMHTFNDVLEAYMHDNLQGGVTPITDDLLLGEIRMREEGFHKARNTQDDVATAAISDTSEICLVNDISVTQLPGLPGVNGIPPIEISQMTNPGIFMCICLVKQIVRPKDLQAVSTVVTIVNYGQEYQLRTKKNLNQKLIEKDRILAGREYKCLVLRSGHSTLFLVDIFANEKEYLTFLDFYTKAVHK